MARDRGRDERERAGWQGTGHGAGGRDYGRASMWPPPSRSSTTYCLPDSRDLAEQLPGAAAAAESDVDHPFRR